MGLANPGKVLDRCTFWRLVHSKTKKDGSGIEPINDEAKKTFIDLEKLEQRELSNGRELTVEVLNELFREHFGPEKRNIVRGYGIGVEWDDVPGIITEKEMVDISVQTLQSQVEDSFEEISRLRKESAKKDDEMMVIKTKLREIEARLHPPLDGLLSGGVDNIHKWIAALTQVAEKHIQSSDQGMQSNAAPFGGHVSLLDQ